MAKRQKRRARLFNYLIKKVIDAILEMEDKDAIFVRRARIYIEKNELKIHLCLIKNRFGDSQAERRHAIERLRYNFAQFWMNHRVDKMLLDVDLTDGQLSVKLIDWGIVDVPKGLESLIRSQASSVEKALAGQVYEHPSKWIDTYIEPHEAGLSARELVNRSPKMMAYLAAGIRRPTEISFDG